jgi:hypothetical protein
MIPASKTLKLNIGNESYENTCPSEALFPLMGGIEINTEILSRNFVKAGHKMTLIKNTTCEACKYDFVTKGQEPHQDKFIFVGRLAPDKGVDLILNDYAELKGDYGLSVYPYWWFGCE